MDSRKEKVIIFFHDYGKVSLATIFILTVLLSTVAIVCISAPQKLRVSFLDIGQGDSILIQTPSGHDMLIDGGPSNAVLTRLSEKMNYFNRDIEVMIATHGDADHVTGLIPVLQKYQAKIIVRSPIDATTEIFDDLTLNIAKENAEVRTGQKGDVIDFGDGVVAKILYPHKNISTKTDTNEASVSIVLIYGDHSFLLTGDLGARYESHLIQSSLPKHVTVYKAGHHGSKTSSSEHLLTYIRPQYAVISAGKDNRYGHPNPDTLTRLTKYARETLSTIDRGTISFITDGRLIEVTTQK